MTVPTVEIVGRFPEAVQKASRLAGAMFTGTQNRAAAQKFLDALRSERAIEAYRSTGLDVVPR
jgi:molybdate transport system substrate-binding protein